jgi:hypothetical protein
MIAVATSLLQRALSVGVLPTTKTEWVAFTVGFVIGIVLDFAGWWAIWPTSFDRWVVGPLRQLIGASPSVDNGGTDPDGGGIAMWVWCSKCDTYLLDPNECCTCCDAYLEETA